VIQIAALVAFYDERVDTFLDGVLVSRPRTKFSADEDESCTHGQDITEDEERQNSHCRGDLLKADLQTGSADWTPRRGNEAP